MVDWDEFPKSTFHHQEPIESKPEPTDPIVQTLIQGLRNELDRLTEGIKTIRKYLDETRENRDELINENEELHKALKAKDEALDKLARLGAEPFFGNSEGNIIAQQALKEKP